MTRRLGTLVCLTVAAAMWGNPSGAQDHCRQLQQVIQKRAGDPDAARYRNHGEYVRTVRTLIEELRDGRISDACADCISSQFVKRVPVGEQKPCQGTSDDGASSASPAAPGLPDLVLSALTVLRRLDSGAFEYRYTVSNVGTGSAVITSDDVTRRVTIQAYFSRTSEYQPGNSPPAGGKVLSVPPAVLSIGESITGTFQTAIPPVGSTDLVYLVLKVDPSDVVPEADETNNTRAVRIDQ